MAKQSLHLTLLQGPWGMSPKGSSLCCTAMLITARRVVWGKGRVAVSPHHHRLGRGGHSLHSKAVPFQLGPSSLSLLPSTRQGNWGRKERRDLLMQVFRSPVVWCICALGLAEGQEGEWESGWGVYLPSTINPPQFADMGNQEKIVYWEILYFPHSKPNAFIKQNYKLQVNEMQNFLIYATLHLAACENTGYDGVWNKDAYKVKLVKLWV